MNASHQTLSLFLSELSLPAAPLAVGGAGGISVLTALVLVAGAVVVAKVVGAEEPATVTLVGSELGDDEGVRVVDAANVVSEARLEVSERIVESSEAREEMPLDASEGRGV